MDQGPPGQVDDDPVFHALRRDAERVTDRLVEEVLGDGPVVVAGEPRGKAVFYRCSTPIAASQDPASTVSWGAASALATMTAARVRGIHGRITGIGKGAEMAGSTTRASDLGTPSVTTLVNTDGRQLPAEIGE